MKLFLIFCCLTLLSVELTDCTGSSLAPTSAEPQSLSHPVTNQARLLNELRAAGASVEVVGEAEQPFLSITGTMIKLQGEDVQIFEYSSAAEMEAQTALISRDGMAVGTRKIHWIDAPHFFKRERLLVLYVGSDPKVQQALNAVLGPQFAGQ